MFTYFLILSPNRYLIQIQMENTIFVYKIPQIDMLIDSYFQKSTIFLDTILQKWWDTHTNLIKISRLMGGDNKLKNHIFVNIMNSLYH